MTGARHRLLFQASAAAALAAIVLALGYLGTRGQPVTRTSPAEKLRIALPVLPQHALMQLAAAKGYFTEEGLNVTFLPASHGVMALSLLAQGKADLAVAAEVPLVISVMKGETLGIAATMLRISDVHAVIARRDRGIGAPRDLVGMKVGATFGTSGEYFLWAFLIRHKLAPDSVSLVDVLPGQIAQALAKGTIDAATTWYPHVRDAQSALGENALSFTDANVYTQSVVVIGRSEFLKGHANAIEKLVQAMLKAEQFMRSRPEEALNLAAEWLKIDVDALRPTWKQLDFLFARDAYAARAGKPLPALIVLELKLPKLDGLGVLKAVRGDERTRLVPVVILTSSKEEQDLIQSYSLGANSYVRKPVDFAEFLEAVRILGIFWLMTNQPPPERNTA